MSGATLIVTGADSAAHELARAGTANTNATVLIEPVGGTSNRVDLEDSKQDKNDATSNAHSRQPVRGHPSSMYQKSHANTVGGSSGPQSASSLTDMLAASTEASGKGASAGGLKTTSTLQADKILALNSVEKERMANVEQIISQSGSD